ncbi:MAG: MCP four helix bundle domain-containing protein [Pseudomonadota bacterium]
MQFPESKTLLAILWGVGFSLVVLSLFIITRQYDSFAPSNDTYLNVIKKSEILSQMHLNLHKSIEMEKSAVMALNDDESQNYADQSRASSAAVEKDLLRIQSQVDATSLQDEKKLVDEFTSCWVKFRKLDQIILELAVQNTNLKAVTLSQGKGVEAVQRFEFALKDVMRSNLQTPKEDQVNGSAWHAIAACLEILNMHNSHIAEISNEKMDLIEMQIKAAEKEVESCLEELVGIADTENQDVLLQAKTAFSEFMTVTARVQELSRENSNAKSLELSLGKKRMISAECAEVLAAFQNVVRNRPFKAAR